MKKLRVLDKKTFQAIFNKRKEMVAHAEALGAEEWTLVRVFYQNSPRRDFHTNYINYLLTLPHDEKLDARVHGVLTIAEAEDFIRLMEDSVNENWDATLMKDKAAAEDTYDYFFQQLRREMYA